MVKVKCFNPKCKEELEFEKVKGGKRYYCNVHCEMEHNGIRLKERWIAIDTGVRPEKEIGRFATENEAIRHAKKHCAYKFKVVHI